MKNSVTFKKAFTRRMCYRYVAALLFLVLAFMVPATPLREYNVQAAKRNVLYVKEVKLFIKEDGSQADAQSWCDSQAENKDNDDTNDWKVAEGNLNEGAEGTLKAAVGVFFCYQTTDDPEDAIRDMAVMNELGNYSEGAYERILEEQQEVYVDMVNDMKEMIEEYRANYNDNVPTAVQAHDFMNLYKEDDSGKLLGDLLLEISDTDLAKILLQANGQAVLMVQEQLAFACDDSNKTWLDRLESVGSYAKLKKKYVNAYNGNTNKALKAMDKAFHDKALIIAESWEDVLIHFERVDEFAKANGLDISKEKCEEFLAKQQEHVDNCDLATDELVDMNEKMMIIGLFSYTYDGKSLYEFFDRPVEDVSGDNLKYLYPLAASLTDAQIAALNETVSLYTLITDAFSANILNENKKGEDVLEQMGDQEMQDDTANVKQEIAGWIDDLNNLGEISVYEGVDRGIFEGGVAVTSVAELYSDGKEKKWADTFIESGEFSKNAIALAAGSMTAAAASIVFAVASSYYGKSLYLETIDQMRFNGRSGYLEYYFDEAIFSQNTWKMVKKYNVGLFDGTAEGYVYKYAQKEGMSDEWVEMWIKNIEDARNEVTAKAPSLNVKGMGTKFRILQGLKIGFAVICVLLAVADIVMTSIALYEYYNRDHIPVPKYMVDLSYNEDKEASYVPYKQVADQNGGEGDLNGGGGKQWLALFVTKDEGAGDPIIASIGDKNMIEIHKGASGSKAPDGLLPLHSFGYFNTPQNLTYADGENGYSFNDKAGGIYLYFTKDSEAFAETVADEEEEEGSETAESGESAESSASEEGGEPVADTGTENGETPEAATVFTTGNSLVAGGAGAVAGVAIGLFGGILIQKKRKKSDAA